MDGSQVRFFFPITPNSSYSHLRFRQRVSRVETTDLTTVICAETKIQGK